MGGLVTVGCVMSNQVTGWVVTVSCAMNKSPAAQVSSQELVSIDHRINLNANCCLNKQERLNESRLQGQPVLHICS